jgi:hypothetical protein
MYRWPRSPLYSLIGYLLALLLVGLTTGALHLFGGVLDAQIATVGYLLPVVASTLLWGLGRRWQRFSPSIIFSSSRGTRWPYSGRKTCWCWWPFSLWQFC